MYLSFAHPHSRLYFETIHYTIHHPTWDDPAPLVLELPPADEGRACEEWWWREEEWRCVEEEEGWWRWWWLLPPEWWWWDISYMCMCVCVYVCVWRDELGGSMRWEGSICRVRRVKVYMYIARLVTEADIDTHTMHTTLYHITHSQHTFHFRHETMARHGDITPSLSHTHTIKIQQFLSYTSRLDQTKCLQTFLVYRRLKPWD